MFSPRDWCISHAEEDSVSPLQSAGYYRITCQTTKCVCRDMVHQQWMHTFILALLLMWHLIPHLPLNRSQSERKEAQKLSRMWLFFPDSFERFMLPWNLKVWKFESKQLPVSPKIQAGPIKAEHVFFFPPYQHVPTIHLQRHRGVTIIYL